MTIVGKRLCRRCRHYFHEGDLYSGCRLCEECYRLSADEYKDALHQLLGGTK